MNTLKFIVCLIIFVLSSQSNSETPPSYMELQGLKAELESTKLKLEICAIEGWSKDGLKQIESLIKYFDERGRDRPNDIVESAAWIFVGRLDSCSNEKDQATYALYRYMASTGNRGRGFQEEKYALRGVLNNDLSKTIAKIKELRYGY